MALNELAHVFGISGADSWTRYVTSGTPTFTGPSAELAYGGAAVPLTADGSHWQAGSNRTLPGTGTLQEASMSPGIAANVRKNFTDLDFAGLQDVGWQVTAVPEPQEIAVCVSLILAGFAITRRWHASHPKPARN